MTVGMALPAHAGAEGDFLSKINASRSAAGLPPVSMHSDLVPDARNHSAEMMAAGQIYHTSNLAGVASGWEALAENVGAGPSVDSLHSAFMNSSGHRANILGDYNYVGVGVASDGEVIWVTVIFMRKGAPPETTTTTTRPRLRRPPRHDNHGGRHRLRPPQQTRRLPLQPPHRRRQQPRKHRRPRRALPPRIRLLGYRRVLFPCPSRAPRCRPPRRHSISRSLTRGREPLGRSRPALYGTDFRAFDLQRR